MTQLLERFRPRKKFFKADILSRYGETICVPELPEIEPPRAREVVPVRKEAPAPLVESRWDEDPERWDGLS